jgi:DNA primase
MSNNFKLKIEAVKQSIQIDTILEQFGFSKNLENKYVCPFHNDKRNSFSVSKDGGTCYCHSCTATGDVINVYMQLSGSTFVEAVNNLGGSREISSGLSEELRERENQKKLIKEKYLNERLYFIAMHDLIKIYKRLIASSKLWSEVKYYSDKLNEIECELYRLDEIQAREEAAK